MKLDQFLMVVSILAAVAISAVFSFLVIEWNWTDDQIGYTFLASFGVLILAIITNLITLIVLRMKYNHKTMKQWLLDKRQLSEDGILNYDTATKALKRYYLLGVLYLTFILLLNIVMMSMANAFVIVLDGGESYLSVTLVALYSIIGILYFLFQRDRRLEGHYVYPKDVPKLYHLLDSVRQQLGYTRRIQIIIIGGCNMAVTTVNNKHYLSIGLGNLLLLNEDELQSIFVHEIGHLMYKDTSTTTRRLFIIDGIQHIWKANGFFKAVKVYFLAPGVYYQIQQPLHNLLTSKTIEQRADELVKREDMGQEFVSGSLKAVYFSFFDHKYGIKTYLQEAETESTTFIDDLFQEYFDTLALKEHIYQSYIEQELPSKRSTHPTMKERMEFFGITSFDRPPSVVYDEHEVSLLKEHFQTTTEQSKEQYAYHRKHGYEMWQKTVNDYELNQYPDIARRLNYLDALFNLLQIEQAYHVASDLIQEHPHVALPYYLRGIIKLHIHSDPDGIEDMMHAAKRSPHFRNGLEMAADYATLFGLKDKQNELRDFTLSQLRSMFDPAEAKKTQIHVFTKLSPVTLPEDVVQTITNLAEEFEFNRVYAVTKHRKRHPDIILIFVVPFENNERFNYGMDNLFYYLESKEETYGLSIIPTPYVGKRLLQYGPPVVTRTKTK